MVISKTLAFFLSQLTAALPATNRSDLTAICLPRESGLDTSTMYTPGSRAVNTGESTESVDTTIRSVTGVSTTSVMYFASPVVKSVSAMEECHCRLEQPDAEPPAGKRLLLVIEHDDLRRDLHRAGEEPVHLDADAERREREDLLHRGDRLPVRALDRGPHGIAARVRVSFRRGVHADVGGAVLVQRAALAQHAGCPAPSLPENRSSVEKRNPGYDGFEMVYGFRVTSQSTFSPTTLPPA